MLLKDLYELTKHVAAVPISFWFETYREQSEVLVNQLTDVLKHVDRGSSAHTTVYDLIAVLQEALPNETKLVTCLQAIAVLFSDQKDDNDELILKYQESCQQFSKRVHTEMQYAKLRTTLKADLSTEEQQLYDNRLYLNEGMEYCLEYHLLLYRHLQDMNSEVEQRKFICQPEVNIGSGNLPGLRTDFTEDEVLEKFIYKILNETEYTRLTKAYFFAKIKIIDAEILPIDEALDAFKQFIRSQIISFQTMGIDRLSSGFFQPYGYQPLLSDVVKQL